MNLRCTEAGTTISTIASLSLAVLLISLIALPGCSNKGIATETKTTQPEIPADFTTYTDEVGLFSVSYPSDWEPALSVIPDLETGVKDVIKAIDSNLPLDKVRYIFFAGIPTETGYMPNVNIGVEPYLAGIYTHDAMMEAEIRGMKRLVPDIRILSQTKTNVGGREATILETVGTYPQLGEIHQLVLGVSVGRTVWAVTCTPPQGEFDTWKNDFNATMRSLRILK